MTCACNKVFYSVVLSLCPTLSYVSLCCPPTLPVCVVTAAPQSAPSAALRVSPPNSNVGPAAPDEAV